MRILVVEDNRIARRTMTLMMEMSGHKVDAADTGEVAIDMIGGNDYAAVISDLRLPGKTNGLDVLALQREKSPGSKLVLVGGFCSVEASESAGKIGALYMEKPLMLSRIMDYIEGVNHEQARNTA